MLEIPNATERGEELAKCKLCWQKRKKMILNKSSIERDDHDKALLCKGLRFAPTSNWSQSFENAEWLNVQEHVRKTEWSAVLGEKNDGDFVLPKK